MNRNSLQDGVNQRSNPLFVNSTLSNTDSQTVAIRYNEHIAEYELAVNLRGHICNENTTMIPLTANSSFTGQWQDTLDYGIVVIGISTDQNSATDGLTIQWSTNGSDIHDTDTFTITANRSKVFSFGPARRYVRVNYVNGIVNQTSFNLETSLRRVYVKPSSHRINDSIVSEDDAELVKSVLTAVNDSGTFVNITATKSNNLKVANVEDGLSIAKGDVSGTSFIHKFGNAPDFDESDGVVTVWDGANDSGVNAMQYTYSTTADIDSISSSNNADTQDIEIQGLDTNYDVVLQTITLTGQTRAALTTSLIRVFRMKNVGVTNLAGNCYCYANTALSGGTPVDVTKIRAIISNGNNQTLMAIYTIPVGKTGYMREWYASTAGSSKTSQYVIDIYARPFGKVFQLKNRNSISDVGTSYIQHSYIEPEKFEEKTDITIRCKMTATGGTGASISAGFDIVLVDN